MRTLHKRSLMPAAIGVTAIAWIARVLSGRLVADRGDRSDSGDYMRTSLKGAIEMLARATFRGHTTSPRNMTRFCLLCPFFYRLPR